MVEMVSETRSTSLLSLIHVYKRQALEASSGFSQVYLRISAFEPSRCEQYEQSSGHRPDFRLTR